MALDLLPVESAPLYDDGMKRLAVITGASSGIGYEFGKVFAEQGHDVLLVARRENKLAELKRELESKYKVKAEILMKDLSLPDSPREIFDFTKSRGWKAECLINNAGFGDVGRFDQSSWAKEQKMIQLNIMALTHLTKLYVQDMVQQGLGRILNVASTAAFQPGPMMAVYYASKAYVLHFTEAVHAELQGTGVTVTALCPGATESEFAEAAGAGKTRLFTRKLPSSESVARYGYDALMRGQSVAVHGRMNKVSSFAVRFIPRSLTLKMVQSVHRQQ